MDDENRLDLQKLLDIFDRRKGLIFAVFIVIFSLSIYLAVTLPDIYKSKSLLFYIPQDLPEGYVKSTVTMTLEERLISLTRDMLSRTRLERIIRELNLYGTSQLPMNDKVKKLRKKIKVKTEEGENSFEMSFESRFPIKAQEVTAKIAAVFVEEAMKFRAERATETTVFIKAEADRLKKEVERQEAKVNIYKAKYRYELPEQLRANLSTLEQHRTELQNNSIRLSTLRDKRANLQKELIAMRDKGGEKGLSRLDHTDEMKTELETLLSRYSDRHPDVIRLKEEIKAVEAVKKTKAQLVNPVPTIVHLERDPFKKMLLTQIQDLKAETKSLRAQNKVLSDKTILIQARVDNSSTRAIELAKINREFEVTQHKYEDLLGKLLESKLSESMEKKKKATRFQLLDPAHMPSSPARPNRPLIVVMGFIAALAAGAGLSILMEKINNTFRNAEELNAEIDLPLLASIPAIKTHGMILAKRRQQAVAVMLCLGTIGLGAALIRLYSQSIY